MNPKTRPPWFFERERYGGILCDIASHQFDQFLFFTGSTKAEIVASQVGNVNHPDHPGIEDFGDVMLRGDGGSGYIRVDWFTPDGLSTWGDGRLTVLGTDGFIEVRKNVDIGGRAGGNHLFLVDQKETRYIDCSNSGASLRRAPGGRHPQSDGNRDAAGAHVSGAGAGADRAEERTSPDVSVVPRPPRLLSVDLIRGLDVLLMLFVNEMAGVDGHAGVPAPRRAAGRRHDADRRRLSRVPVHHRDVDSAGARREAAGRRTARTDRSPRRSFAASRSSSSAC